MSRVYSLAQVASVLLLTAGFTACERSATAPAVPEMLPRLDIAGRSELAAPRHTGGTVTRTVDRAGGRLHFDDPSARGLDYRLDIPARNFDGPITVEMTVLPGQTYQVSLRAIAKGVDVGARGFKQPVRLTVSYASAQHAPRGAHLTLAYLPGDGEAPVPVKTQVNPGQKTLTGYLPHFSIWTVLY